MKFPLYHLLVLGGLCLPVAASAQQSVDSLLLELNSLSAYEEASALQAQLNGKMGVGSHIGLSSRETPGIVSVITAQDIQNMGARDFIDVMRVVPGFDFAADVDFAVGPTIRGNWAMEGKMLLMIDGVKYNELLYQNLFFGNHLPVDQIERVEIIRGPGSAMYGGTAEYGVINITTKGAAGLNGISATGSYGTFGSDMARRNIGLSIGKKVGEVVIDVSAHTGRANRSNSQYNPGFDDFVGDVNLANGRGQTNPTFVSAGVAWKGLKSRIVFDDYSWSNYHYDLQNKIITGLLQYDAKVGSKLTLTPQLSYTNQLPWYYKNSLFTSEEYGYLYEYKIKAERATANLTAGYRASQRLYLTAGMEWYAERAKDLLDLGNFGDVQQVQYQNFSAFGEVLLKHRLANITAGMRFEHHSAFGSAMAPRFAITKHVNRLHFKGLASGAYRAPGIENINMNPDIKPERSSSYELETGYQFTKDMLLAVNFFRIRTNDIIVFSSLGVTEENFTNFEQVSSQGIEVVYQVRRPKWSSNLTYSYSRASDKNAVEQYRVAGKDHLNIGIAAHKLTLHGGYRLTNRFSINPTLVCIGERYGYAGFDDEGEPQLQRFAPVLLADLHLQYKDLLPGLTLGAGIHNLLNKENLFIQAYNGGSDPVPGPGREFTVKASYDLKFKK
ncbi:TonB-dependent receptor [Flammeovirgaceae bacterium 311]|nr:TonB-dependent receptor [Flammeovirgaceae bacterium 311]